MATILFAAMRALVSRVFLLSVLQCAMAAGQANTPSATVEIQYCGVQMGKPPLKYLTFNVTMHNLAARTQWFLWPRSLYEQTPGPMKENGVNGAEIFAAPERKVMVAQFLGSIRLQPRSAGGFQALLLPAGATVTVRDFGIHFWGDNFSPLPIQVVIADHVLIGSVPVDRWAGVNMLSARSADVSSRQITMVRSKFTRRRNELPVTVQKSGEINVANALAKSCE